MPLLMLLAATIALRADAPALTLEQARAMPPAALGDALLAPGHPEVIAARVGVQGLAPPPPPGVPSAAPIEFDFAPTVSRAAGFCERTTARVLLAPVVYANGIAPPAAPTEITAEQTYRWANRRHETAACGGARAIYFRLEDGARDRTLAFVRAVAALQAAAQQTRPLRVTLSVDDRIGPDMQDSARTHPRMPVSPELTRIVTDARAALARLPLDAITYVAVGRRGHDGLLTSADLRGRDGRPLTPASLAAASEWTVEAAMDGERIVTLRLLRQVPPPF